MTKRVRLKVAMATVLVCVLATAPAVAQRGAPFSHTKLSSHPHQGLGSRATATPTATATASATAEPTVSPRRVRGNLPNTGADPLRLALAGLTLLGFGLSLRFRVALADARRPD